MHSYDHKCNNSGLDLYKQNNCLSNPLMFAYIIEKTKKKKTMLILTKGLFCNFRVLNLYTEYNGSI